MSRTKDKIAQINKFLAELKEITPNKLEDYKADMVKKAACERYVEKIVEASTDLAFLIIKTEKFRIPEDDIDSFNILLDERVISSELAARLKSAKGMRNIIAHEYGKIDDEIVFHSAKEELARDIEEFISQAKRRIKD